MCEHAAKCNARSRNYNRTHPDMSPRISDLIKSKRSKTGIRNKCTSLTDQPRRAAWIRKHKHNVCVFLVVVRVYVPVCAVWCDLGIRGIKFRSMFHLHRGLAFGGDKIGQFASLLHACVLCLFPQSCRGVGQRQRCNWATNLQASPLILC